MYGLSVIASVTPSTTSKTINKIHEDGKFNLRKHKKTFHYFYYYSVLCISVLSYSASFGWT